MRQAQLGELLECIRRRQPVLTVTNLASGDVHLVRAEVVGSEGRLAGDLREALRTDKARTVKTEEGDVFINVFNPPLRMLMVGAVHISQALIPLAERAGYDVTVVDPRTAFATPERFAGVRLVAEWPDEVIPTLGLDRRTAVILLTHDPKIDDPALKLALKSDAFYIGALGSTRTHAKRIERMQAAGFDGRELARIHAPIGLDIGAVGPVEIALSIMAEVTAVLRGRGDRSK
ncbi:MAG: XdhC family protein [Hyphomicrobiaceae bacterium]